MKLLIVLAISIWLSACGGGDGGYAPGVGMAASNPNPEEPRYVWRYQYILEDEGECYGTDRAFFVSFRRNTLKVYDNDECRGPRLCKIRSGGSCLVGAEKIEFFVQDQVLMYITEY